MHFCQDELMAITAMTEHVQYVLMYIRYLLSKVFDPCRCEDHNGI